VTHTDVTGRSHITGSASYTPGTTPLVNADLQLLPLSLSTVGQFAPAAGLHGEVAGPVRLTGPLNHLVLDATLTTPDGGSVTAQGSADLSKQDKSYDFVMGTHLFDASGVSTKAPRTQLTANASVHGHGVTAETIDAQVAANVQTSRYDSLTVDSAVIRATAANGIVHVDTLLLRIPHGMANVHGDFGLTGAHTGSLQYAASVDSLGALSQFLPTDTGIVAPRPGILAGRLAQARADSIRIARATELQRAMTGQPMPVIPVDTPKTVQRSALLGALQANGVIQGNIQTFNVDGTARGTGIAALGNTANAVSARYIWHNALSPQSYFGVGAYAKGVSAAGFAVDSMTAQASYLQQRGIATLAVWQGTRTYDVSADYILHHPQTDVQLNALRLRFDSTVYALAQPTSIRLSPSAVDIDSLDLRTNHQESRIFVDGHLPINGPANEAVKARFDITNFDVGNVSALLESDVPLRGLVSIDAAMGGTAANPTLQGAFGTTRVTYGGTAVPEVHGTVAYAGQVLRTNTTANLEGNAPFLHATGTVPVDLTMAGTGTKGSRLPTDRPINVQIDADSLPLDHLPQVSDAVTNLQGFSTLHAHVTGTIAHPIATGQFALQRAGMTIVPAGVTLTDANGMIRLAGDTVMIDSVVARSNGPIRLSGIVGITTLANPSFALNLTANNARVLGGDQGDLFADASLSLKGKLSAAVAEGKIRLLRGVIQIPEPSNKQLLGTDDPTLYSVLDTSLAEHRDLFPSQSPLFKNLRANVGITIDRDVFVRSREANVEIYTEDPLQVTVNLRRQSFVIDGVALSDRGEYRYQGRRFIIQRGAVTFINTQQLDPTLQVTGEYTVQLPGREPIVIQIVISGTLGSPKIALTSNADPPISQTDLLSYLAFGQSSSSLLQSGGSGLTTGGSGSGNIVGRAAALAQQQIASAALGALTDQVSGQAARALGADVFDIMPADVSPDVGNFLRATQIEFGKYIQSRMYVGLQVRPDPASLQRPGFELQEILDPRRGYTLTASLSPRYLLQEPSLSDDLTPVTTSVFGLFLVREWRY
ncbi:MAG TPA: translocation/assembly module TamB domain-containing protein, partial [Gemmatimonadaceae bacterium]|nr:translocation/assembly module TamB domain-containing protein [Gemmatimonadaceae bacterium]